MKSQDEIANGSDLVLKHRHKRSDCSNGRGLNMSDACKCGQHCWDSDVHESGFYNLFGANGNWSVECCLNQESDVSMDCPGGNKNYLSSKLFLIPENKTYLDITCIRTGPTCYDGLPKYSCDCTQGYLLYQTSSQQSILIIIGATVPVSILSLIAILIGIRVYQRNKPLREKRKLDEMVENGFIPIRCNLMVLVDGLDEFKYYTSHVMVALREILPSIVCERLSIYHLLNDNYHIECDKLLVFRLRDNHVAHEDCLKDFDEKIRFRSGRRKSVFVVCVGGKENEKIDASTSPLSKELCLVDSVRSVERWLPVLVMSLFNYKWWWTSRNATYCVDFGRSSLENEYCQLMRKTVDRTLLACGAIIRQPLKTARFKIAFLLSVDNETEAWSQDVSQGYFTFVSSIATLDTYRKDKGVFIYGCQEVILGILRLLSEMDLISCKSMPKIKGIRYDPLCGEFI
ncbi:hypothetical protein ACF0H5_014850 [Mactra antiquata]